MGELTHMSRHAYAAVLIALLMQGCRPATTADDPTPDRITQVLPGGIRRVILVPPAEAVRPPEHPDPFRNVSGRDRLSFVEEYHRDSRSRPFCLSRYERLLAMTWIYEARTPEQCEVLPDGTVHRYRDVGELHGPGTTVAMVARQGGGRKKLSADEMRELTALLDELPSGADHVSWVKLVVVSHHSGESWLTQVYDRGALPRAVAGLFEITDKWIVAP